MPKIRYLHKKGEGIPRIYPKKSDDILQNMNFSKYYRNRGKFIYGFDPNIMQYYYELFQICSFIVITLRYEEISYSYFGLYVPIAFFINIFINSLFPLKKLILVGVFPFLGYALVTGISHALYPICVALTDK